MALETLVEQDNRNKQGRIFVVVGICVLLISIAHDGETAKTWADLFTPGSLFGMVGHAAGALFVYLGARQQDPAEKP